METLQEDVSQPGENKGRCSSTGEELFLWLDSPSPAPRLWLLAPPGGAPTAPPLSIKASSFNDERD